MSNLVTLKSPIMQTIGKIGDMIVLNIIYLITCIPIFTIGAAQTALYDVCFRMGTEREDGLVKTYFHAFTANFKQSTLVWLVMAFLGGDLIAAFVLALYQENALKYIALPALLFMIAFLLTAGYIFPQISQIELKTKALIKNSFVLSLGFLPRSICVAALNILPIVVLAVWPLAFYQLGILWVAGYFSVAAFLNTKLLKMAIAMVSPHDTADEDDADLNDDGQITI